MQNNFSYRADLSVIGGAIKSEPVPVKDEQQCDDDQVEEEEGKMEEEEGWVEPSRGGSASSSSTEDSGYHLTSRYGTVYLPTYRCLTCRYPTYLPTFIK